jgi:chemotaxis protein CheD
MMKLDAPNVLHPADISVLGRRREPTADVPVGMGMATMAVAPARLTAVVGSCLGVAIYCPGPRLGMLAHVVLPWAKGRAANPARYADTAIAHMSAMLALGGADVELLVAKIAGGACLFGDSDAIGIGEANIDSAVRALEAAGIPLVGREVGGTSGRRLCFDLATGELSVESVGRKMTII